MAVPMHLEKLFNTGDEVIVPETAPSDEVSASGRIRMAILNDSGGRLQAIHPVNALVDIDRLNQSLARDLRALSLKDMGRLRTRFQVREIPPLPLLTRFETFIDPSVSALNRVRFYSGQGDGDLVLDTSDYEKLLGPSRWLEFVRPLTDIPVNIKAPEYDEAQLRTALENFTSLRIKQRLEDTLDIPPLPETAQRILHLRMNPNAEVGDLAEIVENDPSLAAQVVSWASSSFYAAKTPVKSIYDAIIRVLGFDLVMNLAMGLSLGRTLKQPRDAPEGYMGYWTQAIWVAQATGVVISMMPKKDRPTFGLAYLAGLLHNFGYLVLSHVFPPHFSVICRYNEVNRHLDSAFVEHHLIGITREQIGATLMDLWNMPEEVTVALRHQKNPEYRGDYSVYANALCLARELLIERGIRLGPEAGVSTGLCEELDISAEKLGEEMDLLVENADAVQAMAGMLNTA